MPRRHRHDHWLLRAMAHPIGFRVFQAIFVLIFIVHPCLVVGFALWKVREAPIRCGIVIAAFISIFALIWYVVLHRPKDDDTQE